jgi:hypothetical protein
VIQPNASPGDIRYQDFNQDGHIDLLMVGNSHAEESLQGWQDAFDGALFSGDGKGNFSYVPLSQSGFRISSDAKAMASINTGNRLVHLISSNQGPVELFANKKTKDQKLIQLQGDEYAALISLPNGKKYKKEFYYGHGYLSQNSRFIAVPVNAVAIEILSYTGKKRMYKPGMAM